MSGGSKDQTVTQKTDIPAFLQPYMQQQAQMSNDALGSLGGMLNGAGADQLVSPFTQNQVDAQGLIQNGVMNPNGVVQNAIRNNNQSIGVNNQSIQTNAGAIQGIEKIGQGNYISRMLPQFDQGVSAGMNADIGQFNLPQNAQSALDRSAAGDYMYGNPAFDEAVQASIRAARPSILSGFAQGGSGAVKGGLAQIGMQQAASDSFARLYGDERNRQLSSATQLGNFSLAGRDQQMQSQQMRNQATMGLGQVLSNERGNQLNALQSIPGIGVMNAQVGAQNANLGALNMDAGLQGVDALNNVGGQQQNLAQQQLTSPINAQQMLIAALNGAPQFQSLLGNSATQPIYKNKAAGALGGAATGATVGSFFGPWGTAIGAAGGGLLGASGG